MVRRQSELGGDDGVAFDEVTGARVRHVDAGEAAVEVGEPTSFEIGVEIGDQQRVAARRLQIEVARARTPR